MPIKFVPHYSITPQTARFLMDIEAIKEKVRHLPLTPTILASLRETARLCTTHYSTMIEGNRLEPQQIKKVLQHKGHFPGHERDEHEVKGYYTALTHMEKWVARGMPLTEKMVQILHALIMADGRITVKPTPYRDGQNVIRDSRTKAIVYMPPTAKDVTPLMKGLMNWIKENDAIPCPVMGSLIHYQLATIHPYYDGNGRLARLLTTFILHSGGYDLKGLYSLEEYYARHLGAYYKAISIGESHNYYIGRAEADITPWVSYFIEGMAISFDNVLTRMSEAKSQGKPDQAPIIRQLDPKQRKSLELFQEFSVITARQISDLFGFKPRTSAQLCKDWVEAGFLEVVDSSNKGRRYRLASPYEALIHKTL